MNFMSVLTKNAEVERRMGSINAHSCPKAKTKIKSGIDECWE